MSDGDKQCPECGGDGKYWAQIDDNGTVQRTSNDCPACNGAGEVPQEPDQHQMSNNAPEEPLRCECGAWAVPVYTGDEGDDDGGFYLCRVDENGNDLCCAYPDDDDHGQYIRLDEHPEHCGRCGARFTLNEDGAVTVGDSVTELERQLADDEELLSGHAAELRDVRLELGHERDRADKRIAKLEANIAAERRALGRLVGEVMEAHHRFLAAVGGGWREICPYTAGNINFGVLRENCGILTCSRSREQCAACWAAWARREEQDNGEIPQDTSRD